MQYFFKKFILSIDKNAKIGYNNTTKGNKCSFFKSIDSRIYAIKLSEEQKMSICIDCKKGALECEWMFRLKQVNGWKAKKVKNDGFVTYDVKECPNFEKNRSYVRVRRTKKEIESER